MELQWVFVAVLLALLAPGDGQGQCSSSCLCNGRIAVCQGRGLVTIPKVPSTTSKIQIQGSGLSYLSEESLRDYKNLTLLKLRDNDISSITNRTFIHNVKLKELDLDHNRLTELEPYTFEKLGLLKTLKLESNQLTEIGDKVFHGLVNLTNLSLKGNKITTLHYSAMESLHSLRNLDMTGNDFHCDCELAWMKDYSPLGRSKSDLVCSSPPSLAGHSIESLSHEQLGCEAPSPAPRTETVGASRGDQLELECGLGGSPNPLVVWYREGVELMDSADYTLLHNGNLLIVSMQSHLAGQYVCIAENVMGTAAAIVHLEYRGTALPSITLSPESNIHVFVGSSFFLPCETDRLTDSYHWFKDGTELTSSSDYVIHSGLGLNVENAQKSHSGSYLCVAVNEMGSVNVSVMVDVTSSVLTCDGVIDPSMVQNVREMVDLAFTRTKEELKNSSGSPHSLLRRLKFPDSGIIEHLKAAEIFDQVVSMLRDELLRNGTVNTGDEIPELSECELKVLAQLSGCSEHQRVADCSSCHHRKYRSIDGSCNNLDNPLQGSSDRPFKRLIKPAYDDGMGLPVGWTGGKPSAREISRSVIATKQVTSDENFTLMMMQMGQFLDHDLDLALGSPSDIVFNSSDASMLSSCDNTCANEAPCFPIPVPKNDSRIGRQCIPFTRSSAVCGTGASSLLVGNSGIHREQINGITSYIDGSMIYGSLDATASRLREEGESGKLREGRLLPNLKKTLLPYGNGSLIECDTGINSHRSPCFLGGDVRTNEQVGLTSMHTLFYREHNRVVAILRDLNPHWDGEKLYQEARRIVVAEWQNIVYSEYLPKILGEDFLGEYKGYNSSVDATVSNAFATAAYRFGHSQIMPLFPRLNSSYEPLAIGPLRLEHAFFAPFRLLEEGGIDPLVRGLISSPVKKRLSHQGLNNNLTEALFAQAHEIALDLAALNIQRGRDHGLPNYNEWRRFCGLSSPSNIEGLREHISNSSVLDALRNIYGDNPSNIDLFVGGLLEDTLPGTQLGPTFRCIIGNQFRRSRDGDRFFFERQGQFSPDQLVQLKQASLSRIICDNADDIDRVPVDAFILQDTADFASCSDIPTVDLMLWKECDSCEDSGGPRAKRSALLEPQNYRVLLQKVSRLEAKIGVCRFNGVLYDDGQTWNFTKCMQCTCQNGAVHCEEDMMCHGVS